MPSSNRNQCRSQVELLWFLGGVERSDFYHQNSFHCSRMYCLFSVRVRPQPIWRRKLKKSKHNMENCSMLTSSSMFLSPVLVASIERVLRRNACTALYRHTTRLLYIGRSVQTHQKTPIYQEKEESKAVSSLSIRLLPLRVPRLGLDTPGMDILTIPTKAARKRRTI